MNRPMRCAGTLVIAAILSGCAVGSNPRDPLERFNRAMFTFNDKIDQVALKPAATAYQEYLPTFVQIGIGNFFGNIGDIWTAANNLLQGKVADGVSDIMRVAINTTFGLAGLIDVGSEAGIPKHKQDFGVTLGVWGVNSGPYVVLPFLGSSTLRDTAALPLDFRGDLWQHVYPVKLRNFGSVVRVVDQRSVVLNASNLIEEAALDRYEFIRDGYLQRREGKINSGDSGPSKRESDDSVNSAGPQSDAGTDANDAVLKPRQEPGAGSPVQLPDKSDGANQESRRPDD